MWWVACAGCLHHSPIILLAAVAPEISGHGVGNCWQSAIVPVYDGCTQVPTKAIPTLSVWMRGTGFRAHVLPFGTTGQTESSTYLRANSASAHAQLLDG